MVEGTRTGTAPHEPEDPVVRRVVATRSDG